MNSFLFWTPTKIHMPSFRRTPESSSIKALDTGLRPQGAGRGCRAAKAATTTLRRCDEFLETPFHLSFKELSHVAQPS
jgi:hypothetical protein